jgi:hypothetical protein
VIVAVLTCVYGTSGLWLTADSVSGDPRGSPHGLARIWHSRSRQGHGSVAAEHRSTLPTRSGVVHVGSARRQLRLGAGVWGSIPLAPFLVLASAALALRFVALTLGSTTSGNATVCATRRESTMSKMRKSLEAVLMVAAAVAEGSAAGLLLPV